MSDGDSHTKQAETGEASPFDRLTSLAATLFEAPAALVSITDGHRLRFRSRLGIDVAEVDRETAFTPHAVELGQGGVLVVEDASLDPRFENSPHVAGDGCVRFYAGAVITTRDGRNVGALCVLDDKPRPRPDEAKLKALRSMAQLAADMLEKREEALSARESLEMLDMAEAVSGVGHWRVDALTGELKWSEQVYHVHGVDPDSFELTVANALALYHPDDRAEAEAKVRGSLETGEPYAFKLRIVRPDGEVRLVQSQAVTQSDAQGRVTALFGVYQDITDREEALNRARRNENRYRLLADNISDVITRVKADGSSNYISPAVERVIGWSPMEMAGKKAQDFLLEEDRPIFLNALAEVLKTGEPRRVQYRAQHRNGEIRWAENNMQRVQNSRGEHEVVCCIRTIDDRKALEDELVQTLEKSRRQGSRYRLLAENMADVICRVRPDGTCPYLSPAGEQILGLSREEMIGRKAQDFLVEADRPRLLRVLAEVHRTGKSATLEYRVQPKGGEPVWVEGSFRKVAEDDPEGELIAVIREIGPRKVLEAELTAAKDRAEAAAKAKSEFLANMSHELRTPLTSVVGFAGLLGQSRSLGDEERRYVERIAAGSEALLAVINDILDYSKLEAGAVELDPHRFDPLALAQAGVELMEGQCRAKGLYLKLETDPDLPPGLIGDSGRLRQVLLNLLSNAVKFTTEGGVTVTASCEPGTDGRVWLSLSVKDTGVGVSDAQVEQLFDRFTQADASTTRTFGGTGLGLAISRQLVEMMGGEISAFGTPGEGSTFWFQVPLPMADGAEDQAEGEAVRAIGAARILMADDAPANRELVSVLLGGMGLTVDTVENGAEAVEAVRQDAYDLVLMDVHMPVMDGLDATRAIRGLGGGIGRIPIIALTANVGREQVQTCLEAGMNGHLAKPIDVNQMARTLSDWLNADEARLAVG
ncbi:PAS domain-containing protein [Brevundimonas sp. BAL450]|nr:PAS domain-containing protein [Brevundimonas sp. BAL450]MBG7616010.1 PAS domain-containing protein [Brevundimonas sp. BAL450]